MNIEASKVVKVLGFEREEGGGRLEVLIFDGDDHPVSGFGRSHPSEGGEFRLSLENQLYEMTMIGYFILIIT